MELVYIENDRPVTDSLIVAESFGKNHKDVLRDIRNLECSKEFTQRNFAHTPYTHEQNGQTYHKYLITQDGFSFLVMGYTGKEAARFKEMYINEFNRMRNELLGSQDSEQLIALAVIEAHKVLKAKNEQIAIMQPKAEFFDQVASSKDAIDIGTAAKVLKLGIGRNRLFEILREKGILMTNNQPYQQYVDMGYFRVIEQKYTKPDGSTNINIKTLVYQKGLNFIMRTLEKKRA